MVTSGGWGGWAKQTPPPPAKPTLSDRVQFAKTHYRSSFSATGSGKTGLSQARRFTGLTADETEYVQTYFMGPMPLPEGATIWDPSPPTVFLDLVDSNGAVGEPSFGNDAKAFFGGGGVGKPRGVVRMDPDVPEDQTALLGSVPVTIAAHGSVTLRFCFGYTGPKNVSDMATVLAAARQSFAAAGHQPLEAYARQHWAGDLVRFESKTAPPHLVDEIKWHSFYLQAAVTYDSYFDEHIIDQGTAYRYFAGFQGAIRDPLQHVLPFIHTRLVGALPSPQNQTVSSPAFLPPPPLPPLRRQSVRLVITDD